MSASGLRSALLHRDTTLMSFPSSAASFASAPLGAVARMRVSDALVGLFTARGMQCILVVTWQVVKSQFSRRCQVPIFPKESRPCRSFLKRSYPIAYRATGLGSGRLASPKAGRSHS
jgi:hypothetical protein